MGYLDALVDIGFKRDAEGRTTYYPWGPFGKGYPLTDEGVVENRAFLKRWLKAALFPFFLMCGAVAATLIGVPLPKWVAFGLGVGLLVGGIGFLVAFLGRQRALLKNPRVVHSRS